MTQDKAFAAMLTGGHPNSLGRTVEVVDMILADPSRLEELYQCYFASDEVVRLRTSNAMKRLWRQHPDWLVPYVDRFLSEVSQIDQASTQWTLAQLFLELDQWINNDQRQEAAAILKNNLGRSKDWIVINNTLQTLASWSQHDQDLKSWLKTHLVHFAGDTRKSVARTAEKMLKALDSV